MDLSGKTPLPRGKIDMTPTRVVRDAVTFRLRWQMAAIRQQGDRMSLEFGDAFPCARMK